MGSYVNQGKTTKKMISTFGGLDKRERIADGAWSDMINMTAAKYPCAASRNKRATQLFTETISGGQKIRARELAQIIAANYENGELTALIAIDPIPCIGIYGSYFSGQTATVASYSDTNENYNIHRKNCGLVRFGNSFLAYPMMQLIQKQRGLMKYKVMPIYASVELLYFKTTPIDGDDAEISVTRSATAPANPENGAYWYDTTNEGLYRYSSASSQWIAQTACRTKISAFTDSSFTTAKNGAFADFNVGDGVFCHSRNIINLFGSDAIATIIRSKSTDESAIICDGYIYVSYWSKLILTRRAPTLQYACVWKNRIWGCRYEETETVNYNEVYGSALGDAMNFYMYEGTAADSYTVSVGTGGKFTGIAQFEDCVIFFKEDRYYILTGSEPPFSLSEYSGAGIQDGSAKSAVVINGYVYYKSYGGIMRMSPDSRPVRVSDALGTDKWEDAIAGTDGERYIVSMKRIGSEKRELFVYDTLTGLWTQEDNPFVSPPAAILHHRNSAFAIGSVPADSVPQVGSTTAGEGNYTPVIQYFDADNANKLPITILGSYQTDDLITETTVEWHADTGTLGLDVPDNKSIRQIQIRGRLCDGARINIEASYDGHDEKDPVYLEEGTVKGTFNAVYTPAVLCDNYKLHFSGIGECVIYSVTVTTEEANDYVQR